MTADKQKDQQKEVSLSDVKYLLEIRGLKRTQVGKQQRGLAHTHARTPPSTSLSVQVNGKKRDGKKMRREKEKERRRGTGAKRRDYSGLRVPGGSTSWRR